MHAAIGKPVHSFAVSALTPKAAVQSVHFRHLQKCIMSNRHMTAADGKLIDTILKTAKSPASPVK